MFWYSLQLISSMSLLFCLTSIFLLVWVTLLYFILFEGILNGLNFMNSFSVYLPFLYERMGFLWIMFSATLFYQLCGFSQRKFIRSLKYTILLFENKDTFMFFFFTMCIFLFSFSFLIALINTSNTTLNCCAERW